MHSDMQNFKYGHKNSIGTEFQLGRVVVDLDHLINRLQPLRHSFKRAIRLLPNAIRSLDGLAERDDSEIW